MKKLISKYRALSFEEKTTFSAIFSVVLNNVLAFVKFILGFVFDDVFFFVAGFFNLFILVSKIQCYFGIKYPEKRSFKFHNNLVGIFLLLAGFQYGIYMTRLIFHNASVMDYDMFLGIIIACVSFVELIIAIKGCFNSYGKGHYYRNIKLINLCSALTAIVLTEIAIMSFASEEDPRLINGIFGVAVSVVIELIAIYIFIAPSISLVDREHNMYKLKESNKKIEEKEIKLQLTNSKFYGNYYYQASNNNDIIDGHILKEKSPIWSWNIWVLILVIVLSEILIFPYAFGALIFHFKCANTIKKLDEHMLNLGYIKINNQEG